MKTIPGWILLAVCAAGVVTGLTPKPAPQTCPGPNCPSTPAVPPTPCPPSTPRPWVPRLESQLESITTGGPRLADGTEVQVYLPASQRIRNIGSRIDGAGMCVMSSVEMMFRWGNLEDYR